MSLTSNTVSSHLTISESMQVCIPLLKEVFEAFSETPINIDIKVNNSVLIKKASELVKQSKREHLTAGQCQLCNCRKVLQRVLILGLFFTGLLPFLPIREQFLKFQCLLSYWCWKSHTLCPKVVSFPSGFLIPVNAESFIQPPHCLGHPSICLHEYKRAFDLGAAAVMTDYPTKLKDFLNNFSA